MTKQLIGQLYQCVGGSMYHADPNTKDGTILFVLAEDFERLQRENVWQSKEIDAQVDEIQRLRKREKDLMEVIDSRDKALGFVPLEDEPSSDDKWLGVIKQIHHAVRTNWGDDCLHEVMGIIERSGALEERT